ncbi:ThuA domain-containing protein [Treponema primitia]|uniref:ThuA domain-containing protein n=1 Tax=Treponema primitia TaxID=88058 RepID=UPI00025550D2|nr:ThuA domain-containing protein [Treponema primitia]
MKRKALILCGGWDGHQPELITQRFGDFLTDSDFDVTVERTTDILEDLALLKSQDLFIPVWTMAKEFPYAYFETISEAIGSGVGLAGCHGGMCDAFRFNILWQFMTGANWVAHPGCDGTPYRINIRSSSNPLTEGIKDFDILSEQYYLHVDPANEVLATTRFPVVKWYHSANGEVDIPQIWTRKWGHGRVYYNALGHHNDVFDIPQAWELMKRGLLWAADGKRIAVEQGLSADEFKSDKGMY